MVLNQTPLGYLFHRAFLPGRTSHEESRTKLTLTQQPGETILIFRIDDRDDRGNRKKSVNFPSSFCDYFGIDRKEKCCDLLLFYACEGTDKPFLYRLVFVELKGIDCAAAVDQIDRAMRAVKEKLPRPLWSSFHGSRSIRAVIVSSKPTPDDSYTRRSKDFVQQWRFPPILCAANEDEIRNAILC